MARRTPPACAGAWLRASAELIAKGGPTPGLATVLVGADPASQVYVRSKGKLAAELGMASFDHRLGRNDIGGRVAGADRQAER